MKSEMVFNDGDAHFAALLNDIKQAEHSIDLETFIFNKDALGERIVKALTQAADRGVSVRVLVDGAGSPWWTTSYAKSLEKAGATTKVFHPFPWQMWNWSRSVVRLPVLLKGFYLLLKANSRNHRKVCLIDKAIAYVGSFNITSCHLSRDQGGKNWRDVSVRLTSYDLTELYRAFDMAWHHRPIKERLRAVFRNVRSNPVFRLNYSRHRRRILYKNLLRRIRTCQQRIWITNAYFVPDNFLLRRLKEAAHRGVDVRILLPKKSDVMMMPWASSTFYFSLLQTGVRIFEYLPSMLHAKSLILDDWVLIGSSNLNHRSVLHDLEVDVHLTQAEPCSMVERQFLIDLENTREIDLVSWHKQRPWHQRLMGRLVLYLKYWI